MPVSLAEVAAEEDLPRAYLEQLVIPLREAEIVALDPRRAGWLRPRPPPTEITLAEALRALEGPLAPMICASEDPEHVDACLRPAACSVNVLWVRVRDAIGGVLDAMTLADLAPPPSPSPRRPSTPAADRRAVPSDSTPRRAPPDRPHPHRSRAHP